MDILGPSLQRSAEVEAVLRTLPAWFGIEDALRMYAADSATRPTFAAQLGGEIIGFVTLTRHFPQAWEVHCMAVAAARRHQGIGSRLLRHAEQYVRTEGGRFLQVKAEVNHPLRASLAPWRGHRWRTGRAGCIRHAPSSSIEGP
jgi:GNAT superfamily N-acetyltransferase